jgi:hypothetical protein
MANLACIGGLVGIACVLSGPAVVSAQTTVYGLTIPAGHPRIWWNAERITRAREWYQRNPFTARTYPPEEGAFDNALLYVLTGNAQYCRTAIGYASGILVTNLAANSPTEGVASDGLRWYGEQVIVTYDWCHAQLTQEEKDLLLNRWNFYLDNIRQHSWGNALMYESNFNWGYMRNMIEWGIATYGENPMADTLLADGLINRWQNNFAPYARTGGGRGGVWQEGSNYGGAIGDYATIPFVTAMLLGRNILAETNHQKENIYYVIYATTPDRTFHLPSGKSFYEIFPFADDGRFQDGGFITSSVWGDFMATVSDHWRDQPAGQYARRWINLVSSVSSPLIQAVDHGSATLDFSNLPLDYYAAGPAFLYGRNQWGAQATTWQLQLGLARDPGHGHNDLGSWQIWRNGRWLSRETTGYVDTILNYAGTGVVDNGEAVGHNTILINGDGSSAKHEKPETMYTMRRVESRPQYSFSAVDLSPGYSSRASHVEREFLFIRSLETMLVFDRIDAASTKTFLAHFEQSPTVDQANRVVNAVNGTQALRLTTLLPAAPTYTVITEGSHVGQYRLQVDSPGAGQTYFLHVLQAKGASDPNVSASLVDGGSSYTVTLTHPTKGAVVVLLQKGMTSAGGSITMSGQTYALINGMQPMTVTSSGPAWGDPLAPAAPTGVRVIK